MWAIQEDLSNALHFASSWGGTPGSPAWVTNEEIINSNYFKGLRHPARTAFLNRWPCNPMLDRIDSTIAHGRIMGLNQAARLRSSQQGFGISQGWHCNCINGTRKFSQRALLDCVAPMCALAVWVSCSAPDSSCGCQRSWQELSRHLSFLTSPLEWHAHEIYDDHSLHR